MSTLPWTLLWTYTLSETLQNTKISNRFLNTLLYSRKCFYSISFNAFFHGFFLFFFAIYIIKLLRELWRILNCEFRISWSISTNCRMKINLFYRLSVNSSHFKHHKVLVSFGCAISFIIIQLADFFINDFFISIVVSK